MKLFSVLLVLGVGLSYVAALPEVYVHIMPWFETKESNPSNRGKWGQHWTMANMNPDIIDANGRRQIAAHYYPEIDLYDSGDAEVVEYQLQLMKYAGVTGVLIDWPGTLDVWDYAGNKNNSDVIIEVAQQVGLKFAVVYEDHNIKMAADAGFIENTYQSKIAAAQDDMIYLRDNYFTQPHYLQMNNASLLLDFGPQAFEAPSEWDEIFSVFKALPAGQIPTFLTLWYESQEAGTNAAGEFCWIYSDGPEGLRHFYEIQSVPFAAKMAGAYPGFHSFYNQGGWPGPSWELPVGPALFNETVALAIKWEMEYLQLNTWNDYGEGTMIEPTLEFGNQFLTILQEHLEVPYTEKELNLIKDLYFKRKAYAKDASKKALLRAAGDALNSMNPAEAERILASL